jgi:hypothetical protein
MKAQTKSLKTASKLVMMSKLAISVTPGAVDASVAAESGGAPPAPASAAAEPTIAPPAPARGALSRQNSGRRKNSEWQGSGAAGGAGLADPAQWTNLLGLGSKSELADSESADSKLPADLSTIRTDLSTITDEGTDDDEYGEEVSPLRAISSRAEKYSVPPASDSRDTPPGAVSGLGVAEDPPEGPVFRPDI